MLKFESWPPEDGKVHLSQVTFSGIINDRKNNGLRLAAARGESVGATIRANVDNLRSASTIVGSLGHEALSLAAKRANSISENNSFPPVDMWLAFKGGMETGMLKEEAIQMEAENI